MFSCEASHRFSSHVKPHHNHIDLLSFLPLPSLHQAQRTVLKESRELAAFPCCRLSPSPLCTLSIRTLFLRASLYHLLLQIEARSTFA